MNTHYGRILANTIFCTGGTSSHRVSQQRGYLPTGKSIRSRQSKMKDSSLLIRFLKVPPLYKRNQQLPPKAIFSSIALYPQLQPIVLHHCNQNVAASNDTLQLSLFRYGYSPNMLFDK